MPLAGAMLLALVAATVSAHAHEPAAAATGTAGKSHLGPPTHPVSLIEGSQDAWTVSRTETGCFLLSASRKKASRLAIGRSPTLGLGLFAVNFALSLDGPDMTEPVDVKLDDGVLHRTGRMAGASLLLVPFSQTDVDASLRMLATDGTLWLEIRGTWLAHGGQNVKAAVADYTKQCADAPKKPAAPVAAAPVAKVGSKAASAP
jgi:hypothetical protein